MIYYVRNDLLEFQYYLDLYEQRQFADLIKKHCPHEVEVKFIDYKAQKEKLDRVLRQHYSDALVLSFDKLYCPIAGIRCDVSRLFALDEQKSPIDFVHCDFDFLNRLISLDSRYVLCYDDDTASGRTKQFIESKLDIELEPSQWLFGNTLSYKSEEPVLDIIDLRDFFFEGGCAGLLVDIDGEPTRKSYISDCVNLETRATLSNDFKADFKEIFSRQLQFNAKHLKHAVVI